VDEPAAIRGLTLSSLRALLLDRGCSSTLVDACLTRSHTLQFYLHSHAVALLITVVCRAEFAQLYKLTVRAVSDAPVNEYAMGNSIAAAAFSESDRVVDLQRQFREQQLSVEARRLQEQAEKQRIAQVFG
jgi:hypothetical protein